MIASEDCLHVEGMSKTRQVCCQLYVGHLEFGSHAKRNFLFAKIYAEDTEFFQISEKQESPCNHLYEQGLSQMSYTGKAMRFTI